MTIEGFSFGYSFFKKDGLLVPTANEVRDVRKTLRNPMDQATLRACSGMDKVVRNHVWATPGAKEMVYELVEQLERLPAYEPRSFAFGCVAGRHRSVALLEITKDILAGHGHDVVITHIHLARALKNEPLT